MRLIDMPYRRRFDRNGHGFLNVHFDMLAIGQARYHVRIAAVPIDRPKDGDAAAWHGIYELCGLQLRRRRLALEINIICGDGCGALQCHIVHIRLYHI